MEVKIIDMDSAKNSLRIIFATFGLVVEDMEQERQDTKGYEACFYARVDDVYMPALDLLLCSIKDLLDKVEASI